MSRIHLWTLLGALCLATAAAGCASTGAVPRPFPLPSSQGLQRSHDSPDSNVDSRALVGTALGLRGARYRNGGADPTGFDCSGFTQYVFAQYGVALPRGVRDQAEIGQPVKLADLAPGDLLFFSTTARGASHVGIAVGGDQFVHAPSSTGVVRVERLSSAYWAPRFLGGRRVSG